MSVPRAVLVAALLAPLNAALADDSSAGLGAGGIVLTKTDGIRMAKEELYVSPGRVRIRFEFVNDTDKDIDTIVAFPLPDIDTSYESDLGDLQQDDPENFVGFRVVADGRAVKPMLDQRAFLKGRDVTALLRAVGAPPNTYVAAGMAQLEKLIPAKRKRLIDAGLMEDEAGHLHTEWTVRTRFYWTQHFPAHRTVVLEHSYHPVTGGFFFSPQTPPSEVVSGYCMDPPTLAGTRRLFADLNKDPATASNYLVGRNTDYVLLSGNNWKGPIGHFHLKLDKLKPENVLSLCWDGNLKKTGRTLFEFTRDNYAPTRDIKMLVLEAEPRG